MNPLLYILCPLLFGMLLGAVLLGWGTLWYARRSPRSVGPFLAGFLRVLAHRCGRQTCSVPTSMGVVFVKVDDLCNVLQNEVPSWTLGDRREPPWDR